ncbi:Hypothetical predicted protein [Pelobates cultripes]|uniref:Uncharacterized protein n=1 Tax=Pelobates cultripes TaxID=61616 RepID=A0AAD1R1Z6_PELCU|nr:Hypothetical predicted protein [Pelobates cultripes]
MSSRDRERKAKKYRNIQTQSKQERYTSSPEDEGYQHMPFLYNSAGKKTRRRSGAYPARQHPRACTLDWATALELLSRPQPPDESPPCSTDAMGWRSQKPPTHGHKYTRDIGDMLQSPTAKRAPAHPEQEESSTRSPSPAVAGTEPATHMVPPATAPEGDTRNLATRDDIRNIMLEMKQMYTAEVNLLHTEMQAVTARVQASEEDINDTRLEVQGIRDTMLQL